MKKYISLMLVIMIMLVCGCNKNEKEMVKRCTLTSNNIVEGYKLESEYTINIKGDVVTSVTTVETVTSSNEEVLDSFESSLRDTYKTIGNMYGGYKNDIVNSNGKLVSTTTIDYSKMNLKKYVEDNSAMKVYVNSDNELLADGIIVLYESLGATCE